MKTLIAFLAAALLAGCASTPDEDPFCVTWRDGQPVGFLFYPSRAQANAFDNAHGFSPSAANPFAKPRLPR